MMKKRGDIDSESVRENLYRMAKEGNFGYVERVTDAYNLRFSDSEINALLALATMNRTAEYLKQFGDACNKKDLDVAMQNALKNNQLAFRQDKFTITPLSWRIDPNYILEKYRETLKTLCKEAVSGNAKEIKRLVAENKKLKHTRKNADIEGDNIYRQATEGVMAQIRNQDQDE